ncbi:hypothetical protein RchiOBHm_Chr6g0274041 [Rosa chinensis]|uniref:Uncharacterized protein n=1 Tax=Rosa chinensis TaxID=74649 RepID=A0A2P6PRM6_ROSCH|nr:hypothetical protein RchiOBHm_Chr6g0274041 [Rosa chinensis]
MSGFVLDCSSAYSVDCFFHQYKAKTAAAVKVPGFFIRLSTEDYDFDNAFGVLCSIRRF